MSVHRKDLLDDYLVYGCPLAPAPAQPREEVAGAADVGNCSW